MSWLQQQQQPKKKNLKDEAWKKEIEEGEEEIKGKGDNLLWDALRSLKLFTFVEEKSSVTCLPLTNITIPLSLFM